MEFWYFVTGPQAWVDEHDAHMRSVDFSIPGIAPNGTYFQQGMKGIHEPIHLRRFIFPKLAQNYVLNTFNDYKKNDTIFNAGALALRKILGLQPIPPVQSSAVKMPVSTQFLNIIPLGIKDDGDDRIMHPTGVNQEPL